LSGDWYQMRRIPNTQECGTCSTTRIDATQDSLSNITISNKEISEKKAKYRNGTIVVPYGVKNTVQGQFTITYDGGKRASYHQICRNSEATTARRHPQLKMRCLPLINGEGDAQRGNISPYYAFFLPKNLRKGWEGEED
ncbi:hypothetical protein RR48_00208, partial [Papilio machaon]